MPPASPTPPPANLPPLVASPSPRRAAAPAVPVYEAVLGESALGWAQRGVWLMCIGVYLVVFAGGLLAGGDELMTMGRAVGFSLGAGVLGKLAVGLLARASLPKEQGPSADQLGQVGSLVDLIASTNVANQEDGAAAA